VTREGYLLAFDFGLKYIGIACAETITRHAKGVATLTARSGIPAWKEITHFIDAYHPFMLVVGLPLNMDATESDMSMQARQFAKRLSQLTNIQITLQDERLTSRAARAEIERAQQQGRVKTEHELAACLIAEDWLRSQP